MASNPLRRDPTRLAGLRRRLAGEVRARLAKLRLWARRWLTDPGTRVTWSYMPPAQRSEDFADKLDLEIHRIMLGKWWHGKVYTAWLRGVTRAYDEAKKSLLQDQRRHLGAKQEFLARLHVRSRLVALNSSSTPRTGQSPEEYTETLVVNEVGATYPEEVETLAHRLGQEFKGVLSSVLQRAARALLDGMVAGDSVYHTSREVAKVLDVTAYNLLARVINTELTRIHASGQLAALRELGVDHVEALVEWDASGDACVRCTELDGEILTLDEAEGRIPLHPNCMCAWVPVDEE